MAVGLATPVGTGSYMGVYACAVACLVAVDTGTAPAWIDAYDCDNCALAIVDVAR